MSFERMLADADPDDAANIVAHAFVDDPSASDSARAAAAIVLDLPTEEPSQKLRRAREVTPGKDAAGLARSSHTEAEPLVLLEGRWIAVMRKPYPATSFVPAFQRQPADLR